MRDHLIIGSTRKPDVVRLLGSAERPVEGNGVTCFRYPIGYCSGFGFDLDYVETCFGADDVLRSKGRYQG